MEIFEEKDKENKLIKSVAVDKLTAKRNIILEKYFDGFCSIFDAFEISESESIYPPSIDINGKYIYIRSNEGGNKKAC